MHSVHKLTGPKEKKNKKNNKKKKKNKKKKEKEKEKNVIFFLLGDFPASEFYVSSIFIVSVNKKVLLVHMTYTDGGDRMFRNVCT